MKQITKNYLFSNFNEPFTGNAINKNILNIKSVYNLTTENNVIEPVVNFSDYFKTYFDKTSYNTFKINNQQLLNSLIYATTYTYYNNEIDDIVSRLFAIDNNFRLFELNKINLIFEDLKFSFSTFPSILYFNNKLHLFSHNDLFLMIENDNYPLTVSSQPNITSIVNFQNYTVFSVNEDKFSIYITEKTDLINLEADLTAYQKIELSHSFGKILKIIIYKNNIYIAQQYGISKLVINSSEFIVNSSCSIQSSIHPETISLIDDYMVFFTTSGLYLFDGNDTKEIFKQISKNINAERFKSVAFNNKYFLMCKYYINDILTTALLQFDIENNNCIIHNVGDVCDLYLIQNLQNYNINISVKNNDSYSILTLDKKLICQYPKYIKFNKITFDESSEKILSEIKIQSIGNYNITLSSENESSKFSVDGSAYIKNIGLKGQIFEIEIESEKSFMIESILFKILSSEG